MPRKKENFVKELLGTRSETLPEYRSRLRKAENEGKEQREAVEMVPKWSRLFLQLE